MTKHLLASAASLALAAFALGAHAQTVGQVGASYQHTWTQTKGGPSADIDQWQVEGATRFDVGPLGAALDGSIDHASGDIPAGTDYQLTGHLNTRLDGALLGGFAGVDHLDDHVGDVTFWGAGVEGQAKLGAHDNLYGQVGYGSSHDLGNPDVWAARAELHHFLTDNFKLQGSVGYVHVDSDIGNFDDWNFGVATEYQFAGTPWSATAGYQYADSHRIGTHDNSLKLGVRYTFGGTLKARDDAGADFGSVRDLFVGAFGF